MSSFIQTNEEVVDYGSINPKLKETSKHFCFFVFYQHQQHITTSTHLQKLSFLIKDEKNWNVDKQDIGKAIQLYFIDLQNQNEVLQSFLQIKLQIIESPKTKLIFYAQEQYFVQAMAKAKNFGIDLAYISSALYSPDLHEDLAQHLGWQEPLLGDLSHKSSAEFEQNVRKWISSPGQRVDMWRAMISVDPQKGQIFRLDQNTNQFLKIQQKQLEQYFISHLCIGHHAQLSANYQSSRKEHNHSIVNRLIFNFESFKKFCCIGNPSLEASTGVVSIFFKDDKGREHEITKQLVREGSKRGIMSLLFSNIDKFQGMKLNGGRLNDGRLEMGVYQSSTEFRLIESTMGNVIVRMNAAQVFMSIGNACLRLSYPRELVVSSWSKVKLLISKETLEC